MIRPLRPLVTAALACAVAACAVQPPTSWRRAGPRYFLQTEDSIWICEGSRVEQKLKFLDNPPNLGGWVRAWDAVACTPPHGEIDALQLSGATIPKARIPGELRVTDAWSVSPNGRFVAALNEGAKSQADWRIVVADLRSGRTILSVGKDSALLRGLHASGSPLLNPGMAWSRSGSEFYVAIPTEQRIGRDGEAAPRVLDVQLHPLRARLLGWGAPLAELPDGDLLCLPGYGLDNLTIERPDGRPVRRLRDICLADWDGEHILVIRGGGRESYRLEVWDEHLARHLATYWLPWYSASQDSIASATGPMVAWRGKQ